MALFKSPPLINPLSTSISISCKKLNVLAFEKLSLNSFKFFMLAVLVPKILVPKSTIAVTSYESAGNTVISLPDFSS